MFEVLIVEDNEIRRNQIANEIKRELDNKVHCTFAQSVEEAREQNDIFDFHLYLISLYSKRFDGIELAKYIIEMWGTYKISIVFISQGEVENHEGLPAYPSICVSKNQLVLNNGEVSFNTLLKQLWKLMRNSVTPGMRVLEDNDRTIGLITKDKLKFIFLNDLLYIRVDGNELLFFMYDGKHLRIKGKLDAFVHKLDDYRICRCHKSFALNLYNINYLEKVSSRSMRVYFDIYGKAEASDCYVSKTYFESVNLGLEQLRRQTKKITERRTRSC